MTGFDLEDNRTLITNYISEADIVKYMADMKAMLAESNSKKLKPIVQKVSQSDCNIVVCYTLIVASCELLLRK